MYTSEGSFGWLKDTTLAVWTLEADEAEVERREEVSVDERTVRLFG